MQHRDAGHGQPGHEFVADHLILVGNDVLSACGDHPVKLSSVVAQDVERSSTDNRHLDH